jgi:hypothetical protein
MPAIEKDTMRPASRVSIVETVPGTTAGGAGELSDGKSGGVEIFAAPHRRRFLGEAGEFLVARLRPACLPRAAAGGDEPHRQTAPEGQIGGQPRPGLAEAELQESMARSAREGSFEPRGDGVIRRDGRFRSLQAKRATRGYGRRKGER